MLAPFIEGYDLALSAPDNLSSERKRAVLSSFESSDGAVHQLGALGLVAESGGWSYAADDPDSDEEVAHRSLVALIRGPRMIVEYLEAGMTRPYVRGVFVADQQVDELLRQTEPKAHDAWQTKVDEGGVDTAAPEVAKAIIDRVKRNVNDFRKSLKPPPRPAEDIRLPELEKLFRSLLHAKGKDQPPPPSGDRPFSIKVSQRLVEDDLEMRLRLEGSVRFSLVDREDLPDSCDAELTISYRIMEEGGVGEELGLTIDAPPGFEPIGERPYTFHGALDHEHVEFGFVSAPYPADWTGRLKAEADMLTAHERVGGRRMSSETRTIRPYRGVDHFQGVLDRAQLYVGDRPVDGGSRVSLTVDEYLNYPISLRLAADEHDRHENEGRIADGLGDLALATSDVELVVLTSAPRLKMVDVVFANRLDELEEVPGVVTFPRERPRALRGPIGGCDIRVYFCLARQFPPRALHPWRKGTWLGRQEFQLRTDLGGVGFTPVRLTDELRGELGLDPQTTKYALVDPEVSVFDADVPADAVSVYIDEGLLDRLAVVAHSPIGKQLQRQLFLDAVWAIAMKALAEITADDALCSCRRRRVRRQPRPRPGRDGRWAVQGCRRSACAERPVPPAGGGPDEVPVQPGVAACQPPRRDGPVRGLTCDIRPSPPRTPTTWCGDSSPDSVPLSMPRSRGWAPVTRSTSDPSTQRSPT